MYLHGHKALKRLMVNKYLTVCMQGSRSIAWRTLISHVLHLCNFLHLLQLCITSVFRNAKLDNKCKEFLFLMKFYVKRSLENPYRK